MHPIGMVSPYFSRGMAVMPDAHLKPFGFKAAPNNQMFF